VAEELRLDQTGRERSAVDGDEVAPAAVVVDDAGEQLLARAGLALEQHREVGGGDLRDDAKDLRDLLALADDAFDLEGFDADRLGPLSRPLLRRGRFAARLARELNERAPYRVELGEEAVAHARAQARPFEDLDLEGLDARDALVEAAAEIVLAKREVAVDEARKRIVVVHHRIGAGDIGALGDGVGSHARPPLNVTRGATIARGWRDRRAPVLVATATGDVECRSPFRGKSNRSSDFVL
jgi:hypothetical protein